jgi:sulfide:quinone oxidoreductase
VTAIDPARSVALFDDGSELAFDLFLGVPKHRAPDVVLASGMTEDGYIPVDPGTLATRHLGVYAVGDVTTAGVPKAGVFAEGAARVAAKGILAEIRGDEPPAPYNGVGTCYIEFGAGRIGAVTVDFRSGPTPTGVFGVPSAELRAEKERFGSERRVRWFGQRP